MNYGRIVLAGVVGTFVYFRYRFLVFGLLPLAKFYAPYPGVYRAKEAVLSYFPIGMASTLVAIIVLAAIYAKGYEGGTGFAEGARFGVLVGFFVVCAVVGDEYVTLNIGGIWRWPWPEAGWSSGPSWNVDRAGLQTQKAE